MREVVVEMRRAMQEAADQLQLADAESLRLAQSSGLDLAAIRGAIEQAANRLERALFMERVVSGQLAVTLLPTPIGALLDDAAAQAAELVQRAELRWEVADASEGYWLLDREVVREMLFNAAANAGLHAAGTVRLSARLDGGALRFEVEDDGPGFPSLDPDYYRERGFGLELAQVCAALHRRHDANGHVELARAPSGGGLFRIVLP